MSELEKFAPNLARIVVVWPGAHLLSEQVRQLEKALESDDHGVLELVRSLIESVCITVCDDRGFERADRSTVGGYLSAAMEATGNRHPKDGTVLGAILSSFQKLAEALRSSRDAYGTTAHGKDGFFVPLARDHQRAYVQVADLLVGAVIEAHTRAAPSLRYTRAEATEFAIHNAAVDNQAVISAATEVDDDGRAVFLLSFTLGASGEQIELRVPPSEALYYLDREAYVAAVDAALSSTGVTGAIAAIPSSQEVGTAHP